LAADYPYSSDFYHTRDFRRGAWRLFPGAGGTEDLAGRSGNSTVLHRPGVSLVKSMALKRH